MLSTLRLIKKKKPIKIYNVSQKEILEFFCVHILPLKHLRPGKGRGGQRCKKETAAAVFSLPRLAGHRAAVARISNYQTPTSA